MLEQTMQSKRRNDAVAYHRRRAAYLRALAANAAKYSLKMWLLLEAERHELWIEDGAGPA
jgi:hypothetical protein